MTRQDLQEQFPESELAFLPDAGFDDALTGVAIRRSTPVVPAYLFTRCKEIAGGEPEEAFKRLEILFNNQVCPAPLILMPIHRPTFWEQNKAGQLVVWEGLHDAVVGTGRRGLEPEVTVYAYPLMLIALRRMMEASDTGFNTAEEFFESYVLQTWLGPQTPYVLYPAAST